MEDLPEPGPPIKSTKRGSATAAAAAAVAAAEEEEGGPFERRSIASHYGRAESHDSATQPSNRGACKPRRVHATLLASIQQRKQGTMSAQSHNRSEHTTAPYSHR